MRIAILALARSGSTSMFHLINEHLLFEQYISISEPFNYRRPSQGLTSYDINFFKNKNNVFVKTFISKLHRPKSFLNNEEGYWDWFFSYFDKIILLDRINKDLQSESSAWHLNKNSMHSWQTQQYYDMTSVPTELIAIVKEDLIKASQKMHKFSEKGYPIFYFEEIFIEKNKNKLKELFEYIELKLDDTLYDSYVFSTKNIIRLKKKSIKLI